MNCWRDHIVDANKMFDNHRENAVGCLKLALRPRKDMMTELLKTTLARVLLRIPCAVMSPAANASVAFRGLE